jgi:hypothetical protein
MKTVMVNGAAIPALGFGTFRMLAEITRLRCSRTKARSWHGAEVRRTSAQARSNRPSLGARNFLG